jgi:hypothetical protein
MENLILGARDLGYRPDFAALRDSLAQECRSLTLHAVYSSEENDQCLTEELEEAGFICHPRIIKTVNTHRGEVRTTNSDFRVAFAVGFEIHSSSADVLLLGTGDGGLGEAIAEDVRHFCRKERQVMTLSLAGSTSGRLNAVTNPDIAANLEIGLDVLIPLSKRTATGHHLTR